MSIRNLFTALILGIAGLVFAGTSLASQESTPLPAKAVPMVSGITVPGLPVVSSNLHVDQFGYLPDEDKVAVLVDPIIGYNAGHSFVPGRRLELRRASDGVIVFQAAPTLVNDGQVDPVSGDRGWWFDFSPIRKTGDYYVYDPDRALRSHVFRIADDVYAPVMRAATRMFYYQREALAKTVPYTEETWTDAPCFLQDSKARAVWAKNDASTERDLSGGWADAGDTNKYPTFLHDVIHPLLQAWVENPAAFTDDTGIPESGNGLPDILDEIKWELDWLKKMQDADGGVFIKMGAIDYYTVSPLSKNDHPRYYGPKCSSSTITTAALFAHSARIYGQFPQWTDYAKDLQSRATKAWSWYLSHPREYDVDKGEIKSGDADMSPEMQDRTEAMAALQLWQLTGDKALHAAFAAKLGSFRQMSYETEWPGYEVGYAEALLEYTRNPAADPEVRNRILKHFLLVSGSVPIMPPSPSIDPYRAWLPIAAYHWGSALPRAGLGSVAMSAVNYGLSGGHEANYRERALGLLHSFHGVNPPGVVYLTNMGACGAEVSLSRIWHDWFHEGTPWASNPPPGYVVGGPNRTYTGSLKWISEQPPGKAFADFNDAWPSECWAITEPGIYYQANYIRLLASFTRPAKH